MILITFLDIATRLLSFAILIQVILSWFPVKKNTFTDFLTEITRPFFVLAKKIPHRIGMIDLSPILVLLMINALRFLIFAFLAPLLMTTA